ncbi:hypothetical protein [Soonwooa sp.]|uniref:hypothetical protein n=1 Tax=Soonwooa sp. TaxID=1938592 RepID=UPI002638FB08|nr:hypothetical protein [Soonwooa sp.]
MIAQVGIDTSEPDESSILDMSHTTKGFLAPSIALIDKKDTSSIVDAKDGLLVFNTTDTEDFPKGYYYWNSLTEEWLPFVNKTKERYDDDSDLMFASILGYGPSGSKDTAPKKFSLGDVTATQFKCFEILDQFVGSQKHSYCGYDLDKNVSWETAFNLTKAIYGYLPVITTDFEWGKIKSNLMGIGGNSDNNIWIGYNVISYPGNPIEFAWVTGEKSKINWSNSSTVQVNFAAGTPTTTSGCVRVSPISSAARTWTNEDCSLTSKDGVGFNYLLVEFNQ